MSHSQTPSTNDLLHLDKCFRSGCEAPSTKKCGGCKMARYCSSSCQKTHWKLVHKQQCKSLSSIHALSPPTSSGHRLLQVSSSSTPLVVVETGQADTLHLKACFPSDRHTFPGSLPNLAVLLHQLDPPITDGSLLHVVFEDIFALQPADRELMDPLFRCLREQTRLQTVQILFTRPLEDYALGPSDLRGPSFLATYAANPERAWKMKATEKMLKPTSGDYHPGLCLNGICTTFLLGLVSWVDREPVSFPQLRRITYKIRDPILLESMSNAWNGFGGKDPRRPGKIFVLESEEDAAAMARFSRIVWVEEM